MAIPGPIRIVEVGPRDGLQNQAELVPTEVKIAFVDALSLSGFDEIEVSSFVSPKWIPQLADAAEVFAGIQRAPGVTYMALVPNEEGLERAQAARVDKIAVFTAASETFSRKNTNASIAETLRRFEPVVAKAGVPVRGYISTAFHCPYEGPIAPGQVLPVARALIELGCTELSIGDTIGKAIPAEVRHLLELLIPLEPPVRLALHLHDTYGHAVDNARAALAMGIKTFDASTGGIGGCPYAPGAAGNVATEMLVAAFGGRTGVDPARLAAAAAIVQPYLKPRDGQ
ncbi:MAG TPA: hydroxymethylglutaryl-CoA lyase [Gemmatimonadales bacterium]|jgi:hydroxymethylglutaryl-CoA lyase|nr:hydroxymethylglutaryl-CoA lyase [Gemmatimonadales bacterium]